MSKTGNEGRLRKKKSANVEVDGDERIFEGVRRRNELNNSSSVRVSRKGQLSNQSVDDILAINDRPLPLPTAHCPPAKQALHTPLGSDASVTRVFWQALAQGLEIAYFGAFFLLPFQTLLIAQALFDRSL